MTDSNGDLESLFSTTQFAAKGVAEGVVLVTPRNWQKLAYSGESLLQFAARRPELFGIIKGVGQ